MATPPLASISSHHRAPPPWPPPKNTTNPRMKIRCGVLAPPVGQVLEAAAASPSPMRSKNRSNRVPSSDVNLQIQRLCGAGDLTEAVRLLGSDGVDVRSYCAVIQLCGEERSLEAGRRAHAVVRASCGGAGGIGSVLGKRLVLMYLKCSDLGSARRVFDEMPPQVADVRVWTSLMSAYAKAGDFQEGVLLFRQMHCCGVSLDAHAISCVLKCIASLGSIMDGEVVRGLLEKLGLGEECAVTNALIAVYTRCGRMEDAMQVFNSMHSRDAISWNSMISGCFSNGWHGRAVDLFSKMWSEGVEISSVTMVSVLPACAELGYELVGKVVHGYSVKAGLLWELESLERGIDEVLGSKLVFMYVKCGDMASARTVFDVMSSKSNVHVWNLLMGGYAKAGRGLHGYSVKTGLVGEISLANALLDMYSNCSDWHSTNQIFESMDQKNVVSWTAMITSYTRAGLFDKVGGLLQEMVLDGIRPDVFAVTSALHAFASDESLKQGKSVHGYAIRNGIEKLLPVANALMEMYVRCGNTEEARLIFDRVTNRDIISWNTLIGGYSRNNLANESFSLFIDMLLQFKPNAVTMTCILPAAASLSSLERGREIHAYALRRGYLEDNYTSNALVDMYVKCGALMVARLLFDRLTKKNLISWTIMIAGYGMHGHGKDAIALFEQMRGSGVEPDSASFSAILYACCHSGLRNEGWRFFNAMRNEHKIEPKLKHYACIVDLLSHTGNLKEAFEFIESMPIEPDSSIWVSLLHGCRIHRDVKLAEKVADRVFKLEPENTGYYVLLSNIYAEAERWEAVKKLKNKFGGRGLRENTGCSWIEVRGKVYVFVPNNRNHPQGNRIAEFLDDVARRMREEGHDPKKNYALMGANNAVHDEALCGHSSKLAIAFGVLNLSEGRPVRVTKNSRGGQNVLALSCSWLFALVLVISLKACKISSDAMSKSSS
nr:pentatricopeptide repeat-containing protein DOT4, chloroplastic-like [Setaria viridis]